MKFSPFKFILLASFIVLLTSCLGTTDTVTTTSTDASFVSLTLAKNDSVKSAVFTLVGDTIVNVDSLPFNTKVDAVYPTFSFKSTSAVRMRSPKGAITDSITLTGKDTINFSQIVGLRNYSSDKTKSKTYYVKVNVHKVEPKLYNWSPVAAEIDFHNASNQKVVLFNDTMFYYLNDGANAYLYKSVDGKSWETLVPTNFPISSSINDMILFGSNLYITNNNELFSSIDRRNWTPTTLSGYNFKSLLYVFDKNLWAVVKSKSNPDLKCRFATTVDGLNWIIRGEIPDNFPVSNFTSLSFVSHTGQPKVLVIGGYSDTDGILKTRWSSEDLVHWVDFSIDNHSLDTLAAGASVISYGDKLFLFGVRSDKAVYTTHFRQSIDEGFSWQKPDILYNRLSLRIDTIGVNKKDTTIYRDCQPRNYQSVVVLKPRTYNSTDSKQQNIESNWIFMIGGKTQTGVLSDVWRSKLNSKNFLHQ
jgi:hypothetical protein